MNAAYRNRAAERRELYGQPEYPPPPDPSAEYQRMREIFEEYFFINNADVDDYD